MHDVLHLQVEQIPCCNDNANSATCDGGFGSEHRAVFGGSEGGTGVGLLDWKKPDKWESVWNEQFELDNFDLL